MRCKAIVRVMRNHTPCGTRVVAGAGFTFIFFPLAFKQRLYPLLYYFIFHETFFCIILMAHLSLLSNKIVANLKRRVDYGRE